MTRWKILIRFYTEDSTTNTPEKVQKALSCQDMGPEEVKLYSNDEMLSVLCAVFTFHMEDEKEAEKKAYEFVEGFKTICCPVLENMGVQFVDYSLNQIQQ